MRNFNFRIFVVFMFNAFLIGACDQVEEPNLSTELESTNGLNLVEGILSFDSKESYEDFIINSKSNFLEGFTNLESALNAEMGRPNSRISEDVVKELEDLEGSSLLKALNSDQMVIIDSILFYLDFENKVVACTKNYELKSELLEKEYFIDGVSLYSFEDEVLELIDNGTPSTVNSREMLFCSDRKATGTMKTNSNSYIDPVAEWDYKVELKHGYQKVGIYFSLMTQIKHVGRPMEASPITPWAGTNTYLHLERYTKFKRRCGSTHEGSTPITESWDNKINFRPHESTTALARYKIESLYTYEERSVSGTGNLVDIGLVTINDGY